MYDFIPWIKWTKGFNLRSEKMTSMLGKTSGYRVETGLKGIKSKPERLRELIQVVEVRSVH